MRELTADEKRAVRRVERAIADLPKTVALYFHGDNAVDRLKGVVLESGDAVDLIPRWDEPDTLIYCDPPYTGDHRVAKEHRYAVDDHDDLWPRLVESLQAVERASVILSGYPCDEAERLHGWRSVSLAARTNMPLRGRTGSAPETLWLSPNIDAAPNLFSQLPEVTA
jgi:DNA adenine methylase